MVDSDCFPIVQLSKFDTHQKPYCECLQRDVTTNVQKSATRHFYTALVLLCTAGRLWRRDRSFCPCAWRRASHYGTKTLGHGNGKQQEASLAFSAKLESCLQHSPISDKSPPFNQASVSLTHWNCYCHSVAPPSRNCRLVTIETLPATVWQPLPQH